MAGITNSGFVTKRLTDVLESLRNNARTRFGNTVNTQPDSVMGQLIDTMAAEITTLWQTLEATYASRDPAVAEGALLDILAYITGITRKPSSKGSVILSCADEGYPVLQTVPAGTVFSEVNTGKKYVTDIAVTNDIAAASLVNIYYSGADPVPGNVFSITIGGYTHSYTALSGDGFGEITTALVSSVNAATITTGWAAFDFFGPLVYSVSNIPATVSANFNGGGEEYRYVASPIPCTAMEYDDILLPALSAFIPVTPLANIASARNMADSVPGSNTESDADLRLRRQESLATAGASTLESIISKVRGLNGVFAVRGYENTANTTDSRSRPAKSFEIVVQGGSNTDIANTIYSFKPAGIETTYGDNSTSNIVVPIVDENGTSHNIRFSKAVPTYLHIRCDYSLYDEERFLASGPEQIKDSLYNFGVSGEFIIGKDVIPQRFIGSVFDSTSGVKSVTLQLDTTTTSSGTPTYTTNTVIPTDIREYVVLPETNIIVCHSLDNTVSVTNGSPSVTINAGDASKLNQGDIVIFGLQTSEYVVDTIVGTTVTLTTNYGSSTNASQTMVIKKV